MYVHRLFSSSHNLFLIVSFNLRSEALTDCYVMVHGMKAIADVEKALLEALDKQYADVLQPLKDILTPKKFGLKYVQKITKWNSYPYTVPKEVNCSVSTLKTIILPFFLLVLLLLLFIYLFS